MASSTDEDRDRIVAARNKIEELKRGDNSEDAGPGKDYNRNRDVSLRTLKPVRKIPARTSEKLRARQGVDEGSSSDDSFTPGFSRESLGTGAAKQRSQRETSGTTARGSYASRQDDRQVAGTPTELETWWQWFQSTSKRVLAYAGFDIKSDARALSEEEVYEYTPKVATFIKRLGIAIDWSVTHTNKEHAESYIWVFEDEEADQLAVIYLKRAKKIGWMAEVARQVEHIEDLGDGKTVAMIVGKRVVATGVFYNSTGGFHPWIRS